MEFSRFQEINKLYDKSEIDKVFYVAAYLYLTKKQKEFIIKDIVDYLSQSNYPTPNTYRLKQKMKLDRRFSSKGDIFHLNPKQITLLREVIIFDDFETIESNNDYLDETLFPNNHNYIMRLVKQINASYKYNLFDATAVLIRRVFEILLIKTYQNLRIDNEIKKDGNYINLEKIIDNASSNSTINLSRSKKDLDNIRNVGNFAAHKIEYNTNKNDLDKIKDTYRAITEELLHKSGLR